MISYRKVKNEDFAGLLEIENACFVSPWSEKDLAYELNENPINEIIVATFEDRVIGFIDYMVTFNSSTISQIAVLDSFRRKGIASNLLKLMFDSLPKDGDEVVEFVTLEVRESNKAAQEMYLKHGFELITKKPHYYSNGEDALYMVKRI